MRGVARRRPHATDDVDARKSEDDVTGIPDRRGSCDGQQRMTKFRLPIQVCVFLYREQEDGRDYLLLHRVEKAGELN